MSFNPEKIKEIGTKLEEGLRDLRDDELFGAFPVVCQRLVEEMAKREVLYDISKEFHKAIQPLIVEIIKEIILEKLRHDIEKDIG